MTQVLHSVISGLLAVIGTATNSVSLSYFVRKETRGLGSRLLILLNAFDLIVCLSASLVVLFNTLKDTERVCDTAGQCEVASGLGRLFEESANVFRLCFRITTQCTGFTTVLLSATRTTSIILPFYNIHGRTIALAVAAHSLLITAMETTVIALYWVRSSFLPKAFQLMSWVELVVLGLIVLLVVLSNTVSIAKLQTGYATRMTELNKRATVTVIILSLLFCVFNTALIVMLGVGLYGTQLHPTIIWLSLWVALPLNSATNPLVYIWRKQPMRQYLQRGYQSARSGRKSTLRRNESMFITKLERERC